MSAPIHNMPELIAALCARRDELNISHETIDNIAGLQSGYTSKLLAPKPIKNLGPMSFGAVLGALGLALVAVPDPQAVAAVENRWQKRKRAQKLPVLLVAQSCGKSTAMPSPSTSLSISERMREIRKLVKKENLVKAGKNGGKRRAKTMAKRARQAQAAHAARKRWGKERHA